MIIKTLTVLQCIFSLCVFSQINAEIKYEHIDGGYIIYAENNEYCPITYTYGLKLNNLKSQNRIRRTVVIPAQSEKFIIDSLRVIDPKKGYGYNYEQGKDFGYNLGDHTISYDYDFKYYLPFPKGKSYKIYQGYNGAFSHLNENSLDFSLQIGDTITAIRDGIVTKVIDKYSKSCDKKECAEYNNLITIYHKDGTFANYVHINRKGSLVAVGDSVQIGKPIAISGNTGWSKGPHLHITIYQQRLREWKTLKTKFLINQGTETETLIEGKTYSRGY